MKKQKRKQQNRDYGTDWELLKKHYGKISKIWKKFLGRLMREKNENIAKARKNFGTTEKGD